MLLYKDGNTPLHLAYRESHAVIIKRLQENGAKRDVQNTVGLHTLITATEF